MDADSVLSPAIYTPQILHIKTMVQALFFGFLEQAGIFFRTQAQSSFSLIQICFEPEVRQPPLVKEPWTQGKNLMCLNVIECEKRNPAEKRQMGKSTRERKRESMENAKSDRVRVGGKRTLLSALNQKRFHRWRREKESVSQVQKKSFKTFWLEAKKTRNSSTEKRKQSRGYESFESF